MLLILKKRLLDKLEHKKEELIYLLLNDKAEDFSAYKHLTGRIKGLEDSMELIKDIFRGDDE